MRKFLFGFQSTLATVLFVLGFGFFFAQKAFASELSVRVAELDIEGINRIHLRVRSIADESIGLSAQSLGTMELSRQDPMAKFPLPAELSASDPSRVQHVLRFEYLQQEQPRRQPPQALNQSLSRLGREGLEKSLIFDRSMWAPLYIHSLQGAVITLGFNKSKARPPESLKLVGAGTSGSTNARSGKLATGWEHIEKRQYNRALEFFESLIGKERSLSREELEDFRVGLLISRFHQSGCQAIADDFLRLRGSLERLGDDVAYYHGLCLVEETQYAEAGEIFKGLVAKSHPVYAEPSRLYLGVVAEGEGNWAMAESAYLDTIDFAQDARLVELAQSRLERMKSRRMAKGDGRVLSGQLALGLGYDTNAVNLPRSLAPGDFQVSGKASAFGLLSAGVAWQPRLSASWNFMLSYSGLLLTHFRSELRSSFDLQSHDVGAFFGKTLASGDDLSVALSFASVFSGNLGDFDEFLRRPALSLSWMRPWSGAEVDSSLQLALEMAMLLPRQEAASAELNLRAESYGFSAAYLRSPKVGIEGGFSLKQWGPNMDFEFRPSRGRDNSFWALGVGVALSMGIGPERWALTFDQQGSLRLSDYYQSLFDRKDSALQYTGTFSRPLWGERLHGALQLQGLWNLSSIESAYEYRKLSTLFMLSATF